MSRIHRTRFAFGVALAAAALTTAPSASAYTYKVIHAFCSKRLCADGQTPMSGVVMDAAGNLYGTTQNGGMAFNGPGTVYKLTPNAAGTTWHSRTLHAFNFGGMHPQAVPILDTNGNLYGTTFDSTNGTGTVYELMPNGSRPHYIFKVLYTLNGTSGSNPVAGLTYQGAATGTAYDGISPLYGAAESGGAHSSGTLYQLTVSNGAWKLNTLYDFCVFAKCPDGKSPVGRPVVDANGHIFGTTESGGVEAQHGVAYELVNSGGTWTESVTHAFCQIGKCQDGAAPDNALTRDAPGNSFGTTSLGGQNAKAGLVFKLAPSGTYTPVYNFCSLGGCTDGALPKSDLLLDSGGTLYGVTANGGGHNNDTNHAGGGTVFALNGSTLQTLYRFCAQENCRDGEYPVGGLIMDAKGNLFGTTSAGGEDGAGVVFELSP